MQPYECDGLTAYRQLPMVVALPETEAQVRRDARDLPRARRAGGARAARAPGCPAARCRSATACCCRSRKFNRILEIDPLARTARVQPGVRNLAISEAAAPYGLYYAPDPSSQIACTIGGNVAENSGGVHCLKYGLTVHNVLQGARRHHRRRVVEIGGDALDCAGLRPAGAGDRLRRHARGGHRSDGQAAAEAAERAQCIMAAFDDVAQSAATRSRT